MIKLHSKDLGKKNKNAFKMIFEKILDPIIIIQDYEIKLANPAFEKVTGLKTEEAYKKNFLEFIHPEERNDVKDKYEKRIKGEELPLELKIRIIHKNGKIIWIELKSTKITWMNQPAVLLFFKDITDKIDLETKYKTLFDVNPNALMEVDYDTFVLSVNKEMEKRFQIPTEKFIGMKGTDFLKKDLFKSRFKFGLNAIDENRIIEFTDKRDNKYLQTLFVPVTYVNGKKTLLIISTDITKIKEAEEKLKNYSINLKKQVDKQTYKLEQTVHKLQESELKYKTLFEKAPIGIAIGNQKNYIIDMNPFMSNISGLISSNKHPIEFSSQFINNEDYEKTIHKLLKKGKLNNYEITLQNTKNQLYTALLDIDTITINDEKAYLIIERDITEIKKKENEIKESHAYLQNVVDSASEIILSINKKKQIEMMNKSSEKIFGYKKKELQGKTLDFILENTQTLANCLKNLSKDYSTISDTLTIRTKKGEKRLISFTISVITKNKQEHEGFLFIGKDITVEASRFGKIVPGLGYLIVEERKKTTYELMNYLLLKDYYGILLTRGKLSDLQIQFIDEKIKVISYNTQSYQKDTNALEYLNYLSDMIKSYLIQYPNTVILIERIDYLILHYSFTQVLKWLYSLASLIQEKNCILLLNIPPKLLDKKELMFLKSEFQDLPEQHIESISLEETLFDMLQFIYYQQKQNILISYQQVGKHFSISKVTTQKRLKQLHQQGLISIKEKGRMKVISITGKGNTLLHNREIL